MKILKAQEKITWRTTQIFTQRIAYVVPGSLSFFRILTDEHGVA